MYLFSSRFNFIKLQLADFLNPMNPPHSYKIQPNTTAFANITIAFREYYGVGSVGLSFTLFL